MADEIALDASRRLAEDYTPEQAAAALEANQTVGVPIETAIRRPSDVLKLKARMMDIPSSEIAKLSPALADFMTDPWNAAVAKDDIPHLMAFESADREPEFLMNIARGIGNRINTLTGNALQAIATVTDELAKLEGTVRGESTVLPEAERGTNITRDVSNALRQVGIAVEEGQAYDYIPQYTFERMLADPTPSNIAGLIIEQGGVSVPDMLAAMYALPAYTTAFAHEMAANRAKNNGGGAVDVGDLAAMLPAATAIALIDRFSTMGMFGALADQKVVAGVGQVAKEIGKSTVREGGTEAVQGYMEYSAETVGTKRGFSPLDAVVQASQEAFVGAGVGGGVRAVTATRQAVVNRQTRKTVRNIESQLAQGTLDQRLDALQQVKLRQMSPPKFREYIRAATKGANLYLDPGVLEAAADAGIAAIDDAARDGTDIPISYEEVANLIDEPEKLKLIRPFLKTSVSQLSTNELTELDSALEELVRKEAEDRKDQSELDSLEDDLVTQMLDTGRMPPKGATFAASTVIRYLTTARERLRALGQEVSLGQLAADMGLRIVRRPDATDEVDMQQSRMDQTQTPEFKAWFGDSKVVDEQGRPLVVYHGTTADFETFVTTGDAGIFGEGAYFTSSPDVAANYAGRQPGARTIPAYVAVKRPFLTDMNSPMTPAEADRIRASGEYDGVLAKDKNGYVQVIAFRPEQIKSAIGNNGQFDPNDPNILRQRQYIDENGNEVTVTLTPEQALADVTNRRDNLKKLLKCVSSKK